jgi:hypothetical protein
MCGLSLDLVPDAVLPTNLVGYLAAGIRVVWSALPDVVAMSREPGSDLVRVYEDDDEGLIEAIRELIQMETVDEDTRRTVK